MKIKIGFWILYKLLTDSILKMRDETYYELIDDYSDYHKNRDNLRSRLERAEIVSGWIKPGSKIADLGCGSGTIAEYLKNNNITSDICCFDLATKNIDDVKNKGFKTEAIDLENDENEILNRDFDYILLLDVIEHLRKPHKVLVKFARMARKGLIVSIPNSGYLPFRMQLLRGIFPRQSFTHLHFWTYKDFFIFCDKLDIEIVDFKHEKYEQGILPGFFYKYFKNMTCQHLYFLLSSKS